MRIQVLTVVIAMLGAQVVFADWPQFRGPNSSGVADDSPAPVEFGPGRNELWRVSLHSGHSSPCVAGDSIFLTTFQQPEQKLAVVCIARSSGKIRWQREVPTDKTEKGHPAFNPASSTPTSDGDRVVAYFGSFGLVCFDTAGKKLWERKMPLTKSYAGNATSPMIVGDKVILYRGNFVDHFLLAVDKVTGKELWKVPQQEPFAAELACTACPIVAGDKLLVHTARAMQAFDVATGKRIWVAKAATTATSTPILAGNEVIVAAWNKLGEPALRPPFPTFGQLVDKHDQDGDQLISRDEFPKLWIFHRPDGAEASQNGATIRFDRVDKNRDREITADEWKRGVGVVERYRQGAETHGLLAIRTDSKGLVDSSAVRVLENQGIPEVPSPLCDGEYVYLVKNGGVLTCLDLKTGKRVYRMRTGGRGTHYASPLIADEKIFTIAGNGLISVLSLGRNPKVLASNDMGDDVYATPAIVDGVIYVRTHSTLYAFGLK